MRVTATTADTQSPALTGRLFTDDDFDSNARLAVSKATQGCFDLGTAVQTLQRITDGDPQSWWQEWTGTADRLRRQAVVSERAGRHHTAGWFYLGAAEAYARALAFVDGMPDDSALLPTFRQHRACWDAFITASRGKHCRADIPFEHTTLPGYLFRPDTSGRRRPTLVITNGSDGSLSGLWAEGIRAALDRRWNAFVFDGPGQQSLLFELGIPFRHDWESVLTPVLDALVLRPDVDQDRLLALGISQGGYWLPRALAFEHRFLAAVVDDGVWDVSRVWYDNLPEPILDTPHDLFHAVGRYQLADVAAQIDTPILICDPDDEAWFTGQPRELYDALRCEKELADFSREDDANHHCEPWARGLVNARICDFFQKHLERVAHP